MNSLLATLIELRIFIITLFVSGAVHLTLIEGGWLGTENVVLIDRQTLRITVTASRSGLSVDSVRSESLVKSEKPADRQRKSSHYSVEPVSALTSGSVSPPQQVTKTISKPVSKKSEQLSGMTGAAQLATTPAVKPELQPEAKTDAVADQQPLADLAQQQSGPLYQSYPAFRVPPEPPVYPRLARKRGIEGQVVLRVEIRPDGSVDSLNVEDSSGSDLLDEAARRAVQHWQFLPAKQNGLAVASYVRVPVDFVLEGH